MTHSNINQIKVNNSSFNFGLGQPQKTSQDTLRVIVSLARINFSSDDLLDTFNCAISMYLHKMEEDHHKDQNVPYLSAAMQCEHLSQIMEELLTESVTLNMEVANG